MTPLQRATKAVQYAAQINRYGDLENPEDVARAVLGAIREPSDAILDAHINSKDMREDIEGQAYVDWYAMIDAALNGA